MTTYPLLTATTPTEGWVYIHVPSSERQPHAFTLPGERISEHLAITPLWSLEQAGWLGWFTVTHIPSGTALHSLTACVVCARAAGKQLATLDIEWAAMGRNKDANWAALSERQRRQVTEIVTDAMLGCPSDVCEVGMELTPNA